MCVILMADNGKFKPLPQRYWQLEQFILPELMWAEFMIPVNMAFFIYDSNQQGTVAYYPGPAGATESRLKMDAWEKLVGVNPILAGIQPDYEALLINRLGDEGKYFITPIDECYKLIGKIRLAWEGLSGGPNVNKAIHTFFDYLRKSQHHA